MSSNNTSSEGNSARLTSFQAQVVGHNYNYADILSVTGGCQVDDMQLRAVTLPMLRRVWRAVEQRCDAEGWGSTDLKRRGTLLKPHEVTMHDINKHLVEPATKLTMPQGKKSSRSLMEVLSTVPQTPNWFVSHFWGDSFRDFLTAVEQHARDRMLPESTVSAPRPAALPPPRMRALTRMRRRAPESPFFPPPPPHTGLLDPGLRPAPVRARVRPGSGGLPILQGAHARRAPRRAERRRLGRCGL